MAQGWARAVIEVGVGYAEDPDRVMAALHDIGRQLREDPQFRPLILEDLTMLGVDALGDSAVMFKCFIKTIPLRQWDVKREMLRRIKKTFDSLGIEIPFPHRTVYLRQSGGEDGPGATERLTDSSIQSRRKSA
jgi:small conductance mechanosensitive channel